LLANT